MGPNILLDKSALQALSQREIYRLVAHYNLVTVPVLLIEILADLKKGQAGDGLSTEQVQQLADKLLGGGYACAHYHPMLLGDLVGDHIPMTGQVPLMGGRTVVNARGEKGIVFDPSPENEAILRWRAGAFQEAEVFLAERWREATRSLDLEAFQREHKALFKGHQFKNLDNLHRYVVAVTQPHELGEQHSLLKGIMDEFNVPTEIRDRVLRRWHDEKFPNIDVFAPYASHCFRVNLTFQYGVITGLITTRRTNRVDIEYLYYAPFCQAFASRDKLHQDLSSAFLRHDQSFVPGDELKKDLQGLIEWWESLIEEEKKEYSYKYGSYPPINDASVTHRCWRKHMLPWQPGAGNRAVKMTKEEEQELLEHLKSLREAPE